MTRSSTKELITPFENPERVFGSKRGLSETPSLVESSSPELDLFSDIEEHSDEETIEIMTETMEQYMSKTRGNYGLREVKLEKAEREAAEVTALRQHVSELEAAATARASEVVALNEQNVELSRKVFALELVRGELDVKVSELTTDCNSLRSEVVGEAKMREEFKSIQDVAGQRLDERVTGLDGRIADVKRDMDDHLYPHMFTAIAGRRWVVGHGLRLAVYKCARSVECHTTMGKVISMAINKGIQEDLKAGIEHGKEVGGPQGFFACTYHVGSNSESDHGDVDLTPSFSEFQPSLDQVSIPIYSESGEVIREMLLSEVIPSVRGYAERRGLCPPSSSAPTTSLGVSDYQVSTLAQPHNDLFDTGVFAKPVDA
ncbi:hypothetical protein Tco_0299479 [Tanacetum coccineum]